MQSTTPKRMLALDGGGVRGLASLLILQALLERINPRDPPKPCDVFDLIGGTSTGGIIAIMLGRLEMDIQSAIDAYLQFSATVFKPKRRGTSFWARSTDFLKLEGKFSSENLEKVIKGIVKERLGNEDAFLVDNDPKKCKVFVCAVRRENSQPAFIRSYASTHGHELPCTIWQACRATAAATSLFDPIKIGAFNEEFVDGAAGFNNPVYEVLLEARDLWPETVQLFNIGCLVSIGTGLRPDMSFGPSLLAVGRTVVRLATETERTAERFHRAYPTLVSESKYFRFNVQKGLEDVGIWEHEKKHILAAATRSYLMLEACKIQAQSFEKAMRSSISVSDDLGSTMQGTLGAGRGVESTRNDSFSAGTSLGSAVRDNSTPTADSVAERQTREDSDDRLDGGPNLEAIKTFGSFQEWIGSFQNGESSAAEEDTTSQLSKIEQLVQERGLPNVYSDLRMTSLGTRGHFFRRQEIPLQFRHLCTKVNAENQVHLIITGLGPSGKEHRAAMFPLNASTNLLYEYLHQEGFGPICGFKISTLHSSYDVEPVVPKTSVTPITVTENTSCYSLHDGYCIRSDERLIDFYNRRFTDMSSQVQAELHTDHIQIQDRCDTKRNEIFIEFKRTARVPDDDKTYDLPPPLASFPLLPVQAFSATLPDEMRNKGGLFFPMLQREAFTLAIKSRSDVENQFALRVFTGGVNALSGKPVSGITTPSNGEQDYLITPQQRALAGYRSSSHTVKQFVAMPMGEEYSVENQVTGQESIGGVQLEIAPRLKEEVDFFLQTQGESDPSPGDYRQIDPFVTPREIGLQAGQRILMRDEQPDKMYHYPNEKIMTAQNLVQPKHYGDAGNVWSAERPTFMRDLFEGPGCMNYDLSSSLVISAVTPLNITVGPFPEPCGHPNISLQCSPFCTMADLIDYLYRRLVSTWTGLSFADKMVLSARGISYSKFDKTCISDLNLGLKPRFDVRIDKFNEMSMLVGADQQSSQEPLTKPVSGWDIGVAMGGRVKQLTHQDRNPDIWNWKAARIINVQIINTVAFRAVTGLCPPICPISFRRLEVNSVPQLDEPSMFALPPGTGNPFASISSVNEIDWSRGAARGIKLNGKSIILCVCCEANICDSLLDGCGHMFCRVCISYYMVKNQIPTCAFCSKPAKHIIRVSAPAEAPWEPKKFRDLQGRRATALSSPEEHQRQLIEIAGDAKRALAVLDEVFKSSVTSKQIEESIVNPDYKMSSTATLQLLLGQAMRDSDFVAQLDMLQLVKHCSFKANSEALHMVLPLYWLKGDKALQLAAECGYDLVESIEGLVTSKPGIRRIFSVFPPLVEVVQTLGTQRAAFFVRLGIYSDCLTLYDGSGNEKALRLILSMGRDPNTANKFGETALHTTANPAAARILCAAGARIDALDSDQNTTISLAVQYGRDETLKVLLEQDGAADVLARYNKFGKAAIHYTTARPCSRALLVQAGADPDLPRGPTLV